MSSYPDGIELQTISQSSSGNSGAGLQRLKNSSATANLYASIPLGGSPTAIRVLDVEAQHEGGPAIIRCKLSVVDLADSPKFTALSYVWGDNNIQESIWCGNHPIRVTRSAWDALRCLRNKFAPLRIWIDAICINQADDGEKASQIPLMSAIYSSAERVYIWLGESNKRTTRAMHYLARGALPFTLFLKRSLADACEDGANDIEEAASIPTGRRLRYRLILHIVFRRLTFRSKMPFYGEVRELFSHPWIGRVWTLQEVLLARTPILVCGDTAVSWVAFVLAAETLWMFRNGLDRFGMGTASTLWVPPEIYPWLELTSIRRHWREHGQTDGILRQSDRTDQPYSPQPPRDFDHSEVAPSRHEYYDGGPAASLRKLHADEIDRAKASKSFMVLLLISRLAPCLTLLGGGTAMAVMSDQVSAGRGGQALFVIGMICAVIGALWPISRSLYELRHERRQNKGNRHFLPWVWAFVTQVATRQCTNPEDIYNGVLGVVRPHSQDRGMGSSEQNHAYRSLCLDLISLSRSLDFLLLLSSSDPLRAGSWTVQWHEADALWIRYLYSYPGREKRRVQSATPGSKPWFAWSLQAPTELKVHALFVGQIEWQIWIQKSNRANYFYGVCKMAYQMISRRGAIMSVSADQDAPNDADHNELSFAAWAINDDRAVIGWKCRSHPTEKSHIALAPKHSRVEDLVALISGVRLPLILRASARQGAYHVVGPAWAPALINGEEWRREPEDYLEHIVLV